MFDGMTTLVDLLPITGPVRLRAGDTFATRELPTLAGGTVRIPDPQKLVHLQMRRYAGCPKTSGRSTNCWRSSKGPPVSGVRS